MPTFKTFSGINNVLPPEDLEITDLIMASDVDLDLTGRPSRRAGHASTSAVKHANLHQARTFTLATRGAAGDLINVEANTVLHAGLGHAPRVWFADLPDGRTIYGNGVTQGVVNAAGTAVSNWGVPVPAGIGGAANAAGNLLPGKYQWSVTHVRLADGVEGGPAYSNATVDVTTGGISFTGLPVLAGHKTNVYLTSHYGGERFLAGSTLNALFSYGLANANLQVPCRTEFMRPPPAGKLMAFWRGRALLAVGGALLASRPHSWELFDLRRDFKQFSGTITMVQPVDGGIWVGTTQELVFLSGSKWDDLVRVVKMAGPVVLGSGCQVPGEHITVGKGRGEGDCMVCIADGWLVAGMPDGGLVPMTQDRYRTDAQEVFAMFRMLGTAPKQVPQYIAIEQAA